MIFLVRAVVDDGAHSFNLFVNYVFQLSRGAKRQIVARSEIRLLALAHFGDLVKEFLCVHMSLMIK